MRGIYTLLLLTISVSLWGQEQWEQKRLEQKRCWAMQELTVERDVILENSDVAVLSIANCWPPDIWRRKKQTVLKQFDRDRQKWEQQYWQVYKDWEVQCQLANIQNQQWQKQQKQQWEQYLATNRRIWQTRRAELFSGGPQRRLWQAVKQAIERQAWINKYRQWKGAESRQDKSLQKARQQVQHQLKVLRQKAQAAEQQAQARIQKTQQQARQKAQALIQALQKLEKNIPAQDPMDEIDQYLPPKKLTKAMAKLAIAKQWNLAQTKLMMRRNRAIAVKLVAMIKCYGTYVGMSAFERRCAYQKGQLVLLGRNQILKPVGQYFVDKNGTRFAFVFSNKPLEGVVSRCAFEKARRHGDPLPIWEIQPR